MSTADLVNKSYTCFQSGDIPGLMETYSDNIEFIIKGDDSVPYAGTFRGKEALMGFFQKLDQTVEFSKFDLIELVTDGNTAVGFVDMSGTVRASGKSMGSIVVHRIHVENGEIVRFEDFPDTQDVHEAFQS